MDAELEARSDELAPALALTAPDVLRPFNQAGILDAADVRVAVAICALAGVANADVLLATALAVRAPRLGHVFVDLATIAATAVSETEAETSDTAPLAWPPLNAWTQSLVDAGVLIGTGDDGVRPLRLDGSRLYLDRYWRAERRLAAALAALAGSPVRQLPLDDLAAAVDRLFPEDDLLPRAAATSALLRRLTVIAGGPGTGKTTAIARITALLCERPGGGGEPPLIALCAPTGKAAVRMQDAVHAAAGQLPIDPGTRGQLLALRATTIHRLLGWRGGGDGGRERFRWRHDAENRLPHDVVIVDETSMVALAMMDRLVEAVRSDARLILVGDPDQLTAIEAGAVLRDIVGPAADGPRLSAGMRALVERVAGGAPAGGDVTADRSFGDGVVILRRGHRFGAAIGSLADAIRRGDADATLAVIADASRVAIADGPLTAIADAPQAPAVDASDAIAWIPADDADTLRAQAIPTYAAVIEAASRGDAQAALAALGGFRLLCAHRHGPYGVAHWTARVEAWLTEAVAGFRPGPHGYAGKPLLVTENDQELRLSNGDTGVIVSPAGEETLMAAFERDGEPLLIAPSRLGAVEPLYAMTIHKSQGSQFDVAVVMLPEPDSPILTRELLYTAVTRARRRLVLVGGEDSLRAAVARPVGRATGLQELLWS